MVAIRSQEADRFLAKPAAHLVIFLVFGPDTGLVSERVATILRHCGVDRGDPFQFVRLGGDDLAADPLRLADEANTIPLFGGRRAISIDSGSKNFVAALEPLLAAPPQDCIVVIEAGALRTDAPLRKLCEREKIAAAIECYPDDSREVARLIDSEAASANLSVEPEAREILMDLLGADRLVTRSELAKLMLYARGAGPIRVEDVEAIVTDASALAVDTAIDGAFAGDFDAISETSARVFATGGDPGVLLGAALRQSAVLHRAVLDMKRGIPVATAIDQASRRTGFFARRQTLARQAPQWSAEKLARIIENLGEAVRRTRREPQLAEAIAVRALWSIALTAKNRGG